MKRLIREAMTAWRCRTALKDVELRNPILVYQMGKVGSSSVAASLRTVVADAPVIQIHTLNPENLAHVVKRRRESARPRMEEHLMLSGILVRKLADGEFPCRVISLVREPVSRALSFVLEDVHKQAPDAIKKTGELDRMKLVAAVTRLLSSDNGVSDPTSWFDTELLEVFGCDVFSTPYDIETGYSIVPGRHVSALVLRLEDLNRSLSSALGEYLGVDSASLAMQKANTGERKWYADDLAFLKREFRIDREVANRIANTRYYRHFYAADPSVDLSKWIA